MPAQNEARRPKIKSRPTQAAIIGLLFELSYTMEGQSLPMSKERSISEQMKSASNDPAKTENISQVKLHSEVRDTRLR
jgi:hypothetical protein